MSCNRDFSASMSLLIDLTVGDLILPMRDCLTAMNMGGWSPAMRGPRVSRPQNLGISCVED